MSEYDDLASEFGFSQNQYLVVRPSEQRCQGLKILAKDNGENE